MNPNDINVLNYNAHDVFLEVNRTSYRFAASKDGIHPSVTSVPLTDLKSIASTTEVLDIGLLTFDEEDKEEIFDALRIRTWKDILTDEQIKDILINPTADGLQKFIEITNTAYFDRVRSKMFELISSGVDVSARVKNIVDARFNELQSRILNSNIVVKVKEQPAQVSNAEVDALKAQLAEMQKMMAQMMAMQSAPTPTPAPVSAEPVEVKVEIKEEVKTETKSKRAGRPAKAK